VTIRDIYIEAPTTVVTEGWWCRSW